jgi:hypothetical protein|tara:strand:+ start:650 stop:1066 length:417 start_codon:yes stop_codon:yes gene_type:complete
MSDNVVSSQKIPDNYNMDFPAIMQDGRLFTDYKSPCIMNADSLKMSSLEYRNFLTRNADNILNNNTKLVNEIAGCGQCSDYSVIPPYVSVNCNTDKCIQSINNKDGIGLEINTFLNENRNKKINNILAHTTGDFHFIY